MCLAFGGDWLVKDPLPTIQEVRQLLTQSPSPRAVRFDASALGRWDSGLVTRLIDIYRDAQAHSIPFDDSGLAGRRPAADRACVRRQTP